MAITNQSIKRLEKKIGLHGKRIAPIFIFQNANGSVESGGNIYKNIDEFNSQPDIDHENLHIIVHRWEKSDILEI
jgi:hypothetical protein